MKIWTVKQEWSGKYLPIVNSSKPQYGGFDYRVSRTEAEEIEVVTECETTAQWLPHICAGVRDYCQWAHEEGEIYKGIKISVTRVYVHEFLTTELVMFLRGRSFLMHITHYDRNSQLEYLEVEDD